jgi:hypothetical protein
MNIKKSTPQSTWPSGQPGYPAPANKLRADTQKTGSNRFPYQPVVANPFSSSDLLKAGKIPAGRVQAIANPGIPGGKMRRLLPLCCMKS